MQDLVAKREKLLQEAADCELIGNLAYDAKKRETFRNLAIQLKLLANGVGAEIADRERRAGTATASPKAGNAAAGPAQS
jgi:hypothetical protein